MKNNYELTEYLNEAAERLIKNTLKTVVRNPGETLFLLETIKNLKQAQKKKLHYEKNGLHIPAFLICSIAETCNLFCSGCYARANGSLDEEHQATPMTTAEWEQVFKQAREMGIVFQLLAGGEPLMNKEVIQMAGRQKGSIFPVFTNGTLIEAEYIATFRKYRNLIPVVSMEGKAAATDSRRGAGVYEQVIRVLGQMNQAELLYGVSITVTRENLHEVTAQDFMADLHHLGCKLIFFIEYVPVDQKSKGLALDDTARAELDARQNELRKHCEEMVFLSFPGDEQYMGGCLAAGRGFFHINAGGAAEACPFSPYSDISLKDHTLREVLQSRFFRRLQEEKLVGGEHTGGCVLFEREEKVKDILNS